ncbi:hypothetical protein V6N11_043057 [Hibiscus sabdariffa]|uniref:tRNA-guanine(15) transglycosylase-like domain-containing protein n=1 Tax=Hibiscus sabdariffa TaxID=183260 RepID=A0ABR2QYW0_9ROSI
MYDCVYPTRTARFGTALVPEGVLKLKNNAMAEDTRPIDSTCACMFPKGDVPEWVCNAMEVAEIDISSCRARFRDD